MTTTEAAPFGDLVRRCRRSAGLTQEELAERSGLSVRAISDLERGVNRQPRRYTALQLAEALQLIGVEREAFLAASRRMRQVDLKGEDRSTLEAASRRIAEEVAPLDGGAIFP